MSLDRQEKAQKIEEIGALVAKSESIIIASFSGLTVDAATKLRAEARSQNVKLRVLKNTLVRRAVADTPYAAFSDQFMGALIYGFSEDPVSAAKVMANFSKTNDKLQILAGAMPNKVLTVDEVKQLAAMPSREELLAKLMATMNEPIAKFVRTLNEVPARLARTVAAVRDAKEAAA